MFVLFSSLLLLQCRRVLKYTYVLGYYMNDGSEKRLFEHLQEQLERSTEHLAELFEAPLEKMERAEVVNFTRVTLQFLRNLIDGLDEGLTTSVVGGGGGGGGGVGGVSASSSSAVATSVSGGSGGNSTSTSRSSSSAVRTATSSRR